MVVRNAGGERAARASLELESPGGGAEATRWGEGGSVAAAAAGSLLDAERDRGRVCSGVGERPEGQVQVSQVEVGSMGQPLWGRRKLYGLVWHSSTSPVELFFLKQLHEQLHERGRESCFGSFTMCLTL
jgi:hypothetical protein